MNKQTLEMIRPENARCATRIRVDFVLMCLYMLLVLIML